MASRKIYFGSSGGQHHSSGSTKGRHETSRPSKGKDPVQNPAPTDESNTFAVRSKPREYFTRYKVFSIYWHEIAGSNVEPGSHGVLTQESRYKEWIFSKERYMIVLGAFDRHCVCLPITTYQGQGVAKSGVVSSHHAIVYMRDEVDPLKTEKPMLPAIEVIPNDGNAKLKTTSRINYSELYTVHFTAKLGSLRAPAAFPNESILVRNIRDAQQAARNANQQNVQAAGSQNGRNLNGNVSNSEDETDQDEVDEEDPEDEDVGTPDDSD